MPGHPETDELVWHMEPQDAIRLEDPRELRHQALPMLQVLEEIIGPHFLETAIGKGPRQFHDIERLVDPRAGP